MARIIRWIRPIRGRFHSTRITVNDHEFLLIILPVKIIFVFLHLLSRAKAVSKKSIAILSYYRNSPSFMRKDRAFMLSLVCVCYLSQHTVRREICSFRPRFLKGVWRYLDNDGHEHITSCLFLYFYNKK